MNRPSLEKFGPRIKKGGLLVVNSSLILEEEVHFKGFECVETFEKWSILFKVKEDENFNHRNILNISRIKI